MGMFETSDGTRIRYEIQGQNRGRAPIYGCQGGPQNVSDTLAENLAPLQDEFLLVSGTPLPAAG